MKMAQAMNLPGMRMPSGRHAAALVMPSAAESLRRTCSTLRAWEYYVAGKDPSHTWTPDRSAASEVIPAPVGERSILWDRWINRWLFTYLNENTAQIELREARIRGDHGVSRSPWPQRNNSRSYMARL